MAGCGLVEDRFVCFLQVIPTYEAIDRAWLVDAFHRRMAFLCKKGQYAIDLGIPVARGRDGIESMEELTAGDMTAIMAQVRNRAGGSVAPYAKTPVFQRIDDYAMDLFGDENDYISMLISVADKSVGEGGRNQCYVENDQIRVIVSGIDDALLESADAARDLRAIAKGMPGPSKVEEAIKRNSYGGNLAEAIRMHHNSEPDATSARKR